MRHRIQGFLVPIISIFIFLSLALLFRSGDQYYESGIYIAYVKSFLMDFDLNIINQLPEKMAWIITPTFHHPDGHPITQTPFILIFHFLELVINKISPDLSNNYLEFFMSSYTLNFLIFILTYRLLNKLILIYTGSPSPKTVLFSLLGSTYLYFNFSVTNVTDVFSIPLVCYILLSYKKFENDPSCLNSRKDLFYFGLSLGILSTLKLIYIPIIIYWGLKIFFSSTKKRCPKNQIVYFLGIFIAPLLTSINTYMKFGTLYLESSYVARILFDYSPIHLLKKIFIGYLGINGFFFLNPLLLLGLVCFVFTIFIKQKNQDLFRRSDKFAYLLFLGIIFFHPIFVMGNMVEDLLPGRATLIALPFMILSIVSLSRQFFSSKIWTSLLSLILLWNVFIIFNFLVFDASDAMAYNKHKFFFLSTVPNLFDNYLYVLKYNLDEYKVYIVNLALYSIIGGFLFKLLKNKYRTNFSFNHLMIAWLLIFTVITGFNVFNTAPNTKELQNTDFFTNKVMGKGLDIYMYNYILDRFNSINVHSDYKLESKLNERAKIYYSRVEEQLVRSTPDFDERKKTHRWKNLTMH